MRGHVRVGSPRGGGQASQAGMHCLVEFTPLAYGVSLASIQFDLGGQTIARGHVVSQNKGSWMERMLSCIE